MVRLRSKALSVLLSFALAFSALPVPALAEMTEADTPLETSQESTVQDAPVVTPKHADESTNANDVAQTNTNANDVAQTDETEPTSEDLANALATELRSAGTEDATASQLVRATYESLLGALSSDAKEEKRVATTAEQLCADVKTSAQAAAAFAQVLQKLGVESMEVRAAEGDATWNMVRIEDAWYHVDVWAAAQEAKRQANLSAEDAALAAKERDPKTLWLCVSDTRVRELDASRVRWSRFDGEFAVDDEANLNNTAAPAAPASFVWDVPAPALPDNAGAAADASTADTAGDQPSEGTPTADVEKDADLSSTQPTANVTDAATTADPNAAATDTSGDPESTPTDATFTPTVTNSKTSENSPLTPKDETNDLEMLPLEPQSSISPLEAVNYTYQVTPMIQSMNPVLYVKTENPDPTSFRLLDKESRYLVGSNANVTAAFELMDKTFIDVQYENVATRRVRGGYLFLDATALNDGGQLTLQLKNANGEFVDSNVTVTCAPLKRVTDYLIEDVAGAASYFFDKLELVNMYMTQYCIYPDTLVDPSVPGSRPYPFLATNPHAENPLDKHFDMFGQSGEYTLLRYFYPLVEDSLDWPALLGGIAKRIDSNCTTSSGYNHAQVQVTYYGDTRIYEGAGNGGHDPIFNSNITKDYRTFDGTDAFGETLEQAYSRYYAYKQQATQTMQPYYAQLSGSQLAEKVGVGSWLRVGQSGSSSHAWAYMVGLPDRNEVLTISDAWVDGRYVNVREEFQAGVTFDQRPTADIVVRNMTYTDINGKQHTGDVLFRYESSTNTWKAHSHYQNWSLSAWDSDISEELTLTPEEVQALGPDRNTTVPMDTALIFDGTEEPGTPYTIKQLVTFDVPSTCTMVMGSTVATGITFTPSDADFKLIKTVSSDESVVKMSGISFYGVGPGTATVTFTSLDGQEKTCVVTVKNKPSSFSLPNVTLRVGETTRLQPTIEPADAPQDVTNWHSYYTAVCTVDEEGNITAHAPGRATVSCALTTSTWWTASSTVTVLGSIADCEVEPIDPVEYRGYDVQVYPTVKYGGENLSPYYYTLTYENNNRPGWATVTITGKEDECYTGSKTISFRILPGISNNTTWYGGNYWYRVFDPAYYASHNPDVAELATRSDGMLDGEKLIEHFVNTGTKEGRRGSENFDLVSYYNANPDLRKSFGNDWIRYYEHYQYHGYFENRTCLNAPILQHPVTVRDGVDWSPVYDAFHYIAKNSDVGNWATRTLASGSVLDDAALLQHFVNNGTKEGRRSKDGFELASYYNANADLRRAFGTTDWSRYYRHYATNGAREGRTCSGVGELRGAVISRDGVEWSPVYDALYYADKNADVANWATRKAGAFGSVLDDAALLSHFVGSGSKEGRRSKEGFELASYYNANADLRRAFGTDWSRYYRHYATNGAREGRAARGVTTLRGFATSSGGVDWAPAYDANYYAEKNPDVANWARRSFSSGSVLDDAALLSHFAGSGQRERRQAKATFNVNSYRNRYADLRSAFGTDWPRYYRHFCTNGFREGRIGA